MLYIKDIHQVTWDDIESFCQQRNPEGAYLDYKQEFPSHLEKTIAAMANTLGGIILIGVAEDMESRPVIPVGGIAFQRGLSETVINIILTNITPPVFPEIAVCRDSSGTRAVVVVRILQSHQTPHAIAGNTEVYLRTGNRNTPEKLAHVNEIEWLREGRRKSEELREQLYVRAENRLASLHDRQRQEKPKMPKMSLMHGWLMLSLCPLYPKDPFTTPPELNDVYKRIRVTEYYRTNHEFPLPSLGNGTIVQDGIVLHRSDEDGDVFHTELNCFGLYFYKQTVLHEYQPPLGGNPIRIIRASEILCRLDEFLDSAIKYYHQIRYWGVLDFRMHLDHIHGCGLGRYHPDEHDTPPLYSPDAEVRFSDAVLASVLEVEKPQLILRATQRVGWAFGWNLSEQLLKSYYAKYKP